MCSLTRIALTGLVLVAAAGPVCAQEGPSPLTIQAAIDEALRRNPDLLALQQQFEAARERPSQERFLAPPTFEAQIWQWPINTLNPTGTEMYMFTVGQELPGLRKRALRETLAHAGVAVVEASIAVQANDVLNDVKEAYAELFLARKAIEVHHATHELLQQLAEVAQARYAAAGISQHDVLTAVLRAVAHRRAPDRPRRTHRAGRGPAQHAARPATRRAHRPAGGADRASPTGPRRNATSTGRRPPAGTGAGKAGS